MVHVDEFAPAIRMHATQVGSRDLNPKTPESEARKHIDETLELAGWEIQDREDMNLSASRGVAVREFPMAAGHGFADYLLFLDGQPVAPSPVSPRQPES